MIQWSGQNWYRKSGQNAASIYVIEKPAETYDQYHERKKREEEQEKPRRVPFGFSLPAEEKDA